MRLWYSNECLDPKQLENTLKTAYDFGFGSGANLENRHGTLKMTQNYANAKPIFRTDLFSFRVTRVELPEGIDAETALEELMPFWDVSGVGLLIHPNFVNTLLREDAPSVRIPYVPPPKEFLTPKAISCFVTYVESLNAMNKAKKAWNVGEETGVEYDGRYSIQGFSEAVPDSTSGPSSTRVKDRILLLKQKGSGEVIKKALMPCDTTPWFGTDLLPEFEVVKAVNWTPSVGHLEEATLTALASALAPATAAAPNAQAKMGFNPSTLFKNTINLSQDLMNSIHDNGVRVNPPAAPKFPHQEDLDVLWDIFTHEYIQRPKRKGGLTTSPIPNSILLAVWKHIALQPKEVTLFGNPKYENSIIRKKGLPKHWARVITPEVLTEYFYAKGETFQDCILYSFYNRAFLNTLFSFYNLEFAVNDELDWSAVPPIDPTPILLALTNPDGLTEDHKKAWIAKFVKERMDMKEKAVAGSQETYSEFISWVRNGSHIGISTHRVSGELRDKFISQFPQAEFTRLMKENGLTIKRKVLKYHKAFIICKLILKR
jgi:hypothetical protein